MPVLVSTDRPQREEKQIWPLVPMDPSSMTFLFSKLLRLKDKMSDTLSWLWDREVGKIDEWIFQPLPALFFKVDVLEFTIRITSTGEPKGELLYLWKEENQSPDQWQLFMSNTVHPFHDPLAVFHKALLTAWGTKISVPPLCWWTSTNQVSQLSLKSLKRKNRWGNMPTMEMTGQNDSPPHPMSHNSLLEIATPFRKRKG